MLSSTKSARAQAKAEHRAGRADGRTGGALQAEAREHEQLSAGIAASEAEAQPGAARRPRSLSTSVFWL